MLQEKHGVKSAYGLVRSWTHLNYNKLCCLCQHTPSIFRLRISQRYFQESRPDRHILPGNAFQICIGLS